MPKTQLTPKQLFERRNTTDVFNRNVIMGVLRILNQKLVYEQIWSEELGGVENVTVPFFFDFGASNPNSERFIQDNYTFFTDNECTSIGIKKIDGSFDKYPQGRVSLSSVSIDSGNITNRFSMATYTKIEDGRPKAYTAYLYSMPLIFQFSLEIRCKEMLTAFKIDEACRNFFFKNQTFHFNYKGTIVPCRAGFPESGISLSVGEYKMGDAGHDTMIKLSYQIQVETYQPVFDRFSERPADSSIGTVGFNIWVNNNPEPQHRTGPLYWKTDFSQINNLVSGQDIFIEWSYSYTDRDLLMVELCYKKEGDEREYVIDVCDNHNFYCWDIPKDMTDNSPIDIMIENTDEVSVTTQPEIYIYPDPDTHTVEPGNVYVKSKGFFITPEPNWKVNAVISYQTKSGEIKEYPAVIHTKNYQIDSEASIEFNCFVYENDVDTNRIKIILRDYYQKENMCETDWISIF